MDLQMILIFIRRKILSIEFVDVDMKIMQIDIQNYIVALEKLTI